MPSSPVSISYLFATATFETKPFVSSGSARAAPAAAQSKAALINNNFIVFSLLAELLHFRCGRSVVSGTTRLVRR
jgi:hypothetical protein